MTKLKLLSFVVLAALLGCGSPEAVPTPTQVLFRINASDELKGRLQELRVSASVYGGRSWRGPVTETINIAGLPWPIDVPVHPRNANDQSRSVELVVEGYGNGQLLMQQRAVTTFLANRHLVLPLNLFTCPAVEPNFVCAPPGCQGPDCPSCTPAGSCDAVGLTPPDTLVVVSPAGAGDASVVSGEFEGGAPGMPGMIGAPLAPDSSTGAIATGLTEAGTPSLSGMDAGPREPDSGQPPVMQPDAGPPAECSATRACDPGFSCMNSKCISACEQTRCDPNATCSLLAGAPVCTCNSGFLAQGTGTAVTCQMDVTCAQLGCDRNATCEGGGGTLRTCKCNMGYSGTGMTCAPVSCQALTIANGTVTGGTTFQQVATHRCNTGYVLATGVGSTTRTCGADMQWSGSPPRCDLVSCGAPPAVANATPSPSTPGTYNSTATYSCAANYMLSGSATITCQASGSWTTGRPTCTANPVCGNGRVETGEQCERSTSTDPWKCSATCQRSTDYNQCFPTSTNGDSTSCGGGRCTYGFCSPFCTSVATCPTPPNGTVACASGICISGNCRNSGDCAPGLGCTKDPGASVGACTGCTDASQCLSNICRDVDGSEPPFSVGRYGRCQ